MNQVTTSNWSKESINILDKVVNFLGGEIGYLFEILNTLPSFIITILFILLVLAIAGILHSHLLGIYKNRHEWKPKANSKLMYSYFCGSGAFQRKLAYKEAHKLLHDRKWSWFSIAGLAYRLGNFMHKSKMLLFVCSLFYLPMAILGFVEMVFRITIGTVWLLCASFVHRTILFVLQWISYLLIPFWRVSDKRARIKQHCPHCYKTFNLPSFRCSHCGIIHNQLIPSRCGIMFSRCECGTFLPCSIFTGRSKLSAICPKCKSNIWTANAKQFFIQLIGGNSSGKTAFLASFQHQYIDHSFRTKNLSIYGELHKDFEQLEQMYKTGITEPSSATSVSTYNLIHKYKGTPKHNLVIIDIPDEVIMSGVYERNPINFGYSDGVIIILDPLSVASVREECKKSGDIRDVENYSKDDVDALVVRFIQQYSEITGRSAHKMIDTPAAVVISKIDVKVIKREVGLPKIKITYDSNPGVYKNDQTRARNEICRDYLYKIGLANTLNNLESIFSKVNYFPISAIGHLFESGKQFEPVGVMEPITWIAHVGKSGIYKVLKKVQRRISR